MESILFCPLISSQSPLPYCNFPVRDGWELASSTHKLTITCVYFPQTCQSCFKTIPKGDVVVMAEFDENEVACYHAACFCCSTCWELLVDLTYYRYGNKIYCGRHHAEMSRQRCFGCDEVSRICFKMTLCEGLFKHLKLQVGMSIQRQQKNTKFKDVTVNQK